MKYAKFKANKDPGGKKEQSVQIIFLNNLHILFLLITRLVASKQNVLLHIFFCSLHIICLKEQIFY